MSSFRTTFAYTNITHLEAGQIIAKLAGQHNWNAVLSRELLEPLGMKDSSYTADAIKAAANHAEGHRWTPAGTIEVPFFYVPYVFGGTGDINSTVEDMARWIRLLLASGTFEGRRIVSSENLAGDAHRARRHERQDILRQRLATSSGTTGEPKALGR